MLYKSLSFARFVREASKISEREAAVLHFRLATTGSVKESNCHPFRRGDVLFAHNGMLSVEVTGDKTDSETFFERVLYHAVCRYGLFSDEVAAVMRPVSVYSRFAVMQGGAVATFGSFSERGGCLYSNLRFACRSAYPAR
jgi:predicted glutamine amidotransferase